MLISVFQYQFCLHLVQMILGYCHMFGAQEGEVKCHLGVKRSGGIWSCAPHFGYSFCLTCAHFCISVSILFALGTNDPWVLPHVWCPVGRGQRSSRGQKVRWYLVMCTTFWLKFLLNLCSFLYFSINFVCTWYK